MPARAAVDYILFLTLDPKFEVNPNEVSGTKWLSKAELDAFFQDPSASLPLLLSLPLFLLALLTRPRPHLHAESTFTPWFRLIAESFLYKWWDALLASRTSDSDLLDAKALIPLVEEAKADMAQIIRM